MKLSHGGKFQPKKKSRLMLAKSLDRINQQAEISLNL